MLEARQLTIGYVVHGSSKIVQSEISLSLQPGQMVALIGPNGCGKSTLLRTLAALQEPLRGSVYIGKEPIHRQSLVQRAQQLSVVLTDRVEVPHLTVQMLVALGRNPYTGWAGTLSEEDRRIVQQSLQAVNLDSFACRPVSSLSDGERQRAMIARALAQDTPYILLDEPTAHLDIHNRVAIMLLLSRLAHTLKKGILLSTHELDLALQIADSLWLMRSQGGIVEGKPEVLIRNGQLQQVFAGESFYFDAPSRRFVIRKPE